MTLINPKLKISKKLAIYGKKNKKIDKELK